jgi:NADH-quinone oxidoreductase subunit N
VPAFQDINQAAGLIIPEIILIATVCIMFLAAPFLVSESGKAAAGLRHRWGTLTLLALLSACWAWLRSPAAPDALGPFQPDAFSWYVRGVTLIAGILLTLVVWDQTEDGHAAESFACLLAILAGANFVALANDLVGIFLGLEMVSIPTYILLYMGRSDWMSREATIKYFLLSIFSSALVLYGLAWIFGLAGSTNFVAIAAKTPSFSANPMLLVALALLLAGISFRLTAVPFHFYAPDVFQGVAPSASAMLSFLPKLVGFAAILRIFPLCLKVVGPETAPPDAPATLITGLAVLTMTFGNIMALRQKNVLRLLAWSSISHGGYMLVGLALTGAAVSQGNVGDGIAALLFYLPVYGIMSIGVFAVLSAAGGRRPLRSLEDLYGLSQTNPSAALMLTVCVFGLSGLPPTGGFIGKLNLFLAAWAQGDQRSRILAIILAANAVIAAAYYLRIIGLMYFEQSRVIAEEDSRPAATAAGVVCSVATLALFIKPQWLWDAAAAAAAALAA